MIESLSEENERSRIKSGVVYAVLSNVWWGLLPIYWRAIEAVDSTEAMAHRILWSFVFTIVLIFLLKRWSAFKQAFTWHNFLRVTFCSLMIGANWYLYIWANQHGHTIDSSLGYYICPLFNVALGMIVLKERLNGWQLLSLFVAMFGVLIQVFQLGKVPWIALAIAITFSIYSLAKKVLQMDSLTSLSVETLIMLPIALIYLAGLEFQGADAFYIHSPLMFLLLLASGILTVFPLLWYAEGTKRVPLSMMGFLQYLSPTISLCLGIFVFQETFSIYHFISFLFIWVALAIYSFSSVKSIRKS